MNPEWEDPAFFTEDGRQVGGEIVHRFPYKVVRDSKFLNKRFCNLVAALITESIFPPDFAMGVYLEHPPRKDSRRGVAVRLWVRDVTDTALVRRTIVDFARLMRTSESLITFQAFDSKRIVH